MPSKGKRVAARQGNLRRRRSNANRTNQPSTPQPVATAAPQSAATRSAATAVSDAPVAAAAQAPATATRATGRPQTQPLGRRFDRPAAYNHVGSELMRIGIYSGVLLVALVAVSFVI